LTTNTTAITTNWFLKALWICSISVLLILLYKPGFSQSALLSDRPLKQVLNELEKEFNIYFSYNPEEVRNQRVNYNKSQSNFEILLEDVLDETELVFERVNDQFYVVKRASSRFINLDIIDSESNTPLPFAAVRLKGTDLGKVADENGNIKLVISQPRNTILVISFLGFEDFELDVTDIDSKEPIEVYLQTEPLDLNDFEIKEYINVGIVSDPKANSFKILPQEMEIIPGLSERDILLSAQIISGLTSTDESANGINIRGSSKDNALLYWNNVPIYHTAHYFGNISSFIPSSIGSLDVYKNFIPVRYGGATSGLIAINSRNEINAEKKFEASLNMTHADFYAKVPTLDEFGSLMVAVRRSYNDILATPTFNAYTRKLFESRVIETTPNGRVLDDFDDEKAFSNDLTFSDFNLQWNYKPNDRNSFALSLLSNTSEFNYLEDEIEDFENIELNHSIESFGLNGIWEHRINDKNSLSTSLSYSDYGMSYSFINRRNEENENDDDITGRENGISNLELRVSNKHVFNEQSIVEFGYQLNSMDVSNLIVEDFFIEADDNEELNSNGAINAIFADYNFRPTDQLELVASGRFSRVGTLGESFFSPQLKLNYSPSKALIFKSSFGVYHQYLSTIIENEFTLSNAIEQQWVLAANFEDDRTVPVIINRQTNLGFVYNEKSWLVDFDIYYKDIDGIIARNQGFDVDPLDEFNQGFETIRGIDLTVRKRWKYLRTWVSYNFQDSQVSFPELFNQDFASALNIRHQLRLSSTYTLNSFEFSLGYVYKGGLPYTPADRIRINREPRDQRPGPGQGGNNNDDDFDPDDEFVSLQFESPNSARLPLYHRVDFSVWHKFQSKTGSFNGEIGLSLMNIFDRRNTFNRNYFVGFDDRDRPVLFERTKYFLEFTPNLSFRVWF